MRLPQFDGTPRRWPGLFTALALVVAFAGPAPAQVGFRNVYDVQVSSDYSVLEVQETPDGGYAAAGGRPMFLLKTDAAGGLSFFNRYDADEATSLDVTSDGGFLIAGEKLNYDDYLVMKTDAAGAVQWSRTYSQGTFEQGLYSVRETPDGGAIASGIWTLKLDAAGVIEWNALHVGGGGNVNCVRTCSDGGYVATGEGSYGNPAGDYNLVVTRLTAGGTPAWNKAFGGSAYDWGAGCAQTSDDGFIVTGWTTSFGAGDSDGFLLRLDAAGDVTWAFTYASGGDDAFQAVRETADGGFIAAGRIDGQAALVKADDAGNLMWAHAFPTSPAARTSTLYSVDIASDGGFIAAGRDESNRFLLIRTDDAGAAGDCSPVDPAVTVSAAPFLTAVNSTFSPGTWATAVDTTSPSPAAPSTIPCTPVTNRPPSCGAGADLLVACDGADLGGAFASDPDLDALTYSWTSSCAGTVFAPSADALNPGVTFGLGCSSSCDLTLSVSDGNGGACSDTIRVVVDCAAFPAADCDADGEPNGTDCAPADPSAFAIPGEVPRLDVAKTLPGGDALLGWTDVSAAAGTGTRHDVVTGQISALWLDRAFTRASCLVQDVVTTTSTDARAIPPHAPGFPGDGFYYLVRAQDACGSGSYGSGTLGPRALDTMLCE